MSANYLKVYGAYYMFPGVNRWCMIILMSKCSTCQYVGFHKDTYKFQSTERPYGKYK